MSKILGTRVHEANAAESDRSRAGPLKASRIRHAGQAGMYAKHTRQECAQARDEPLTEQETDNVLFGRHSAPERRCSSRTFRYGYLVTT